METNGGAEAQLVDVEFSVHGHPTHIERYTHTQTQPAHGGPASIVKAKRNLRGYIERGIASEID